MPTPYAPDLASQIIELAWADEVSFNAIETQFGLSEAQVIVLMRQQLKAKSFKNWRARVRGRMAKHGLPGRSLHTKQTIATYDEPVPLSAYGDDAPARKQLT